MFEWNGRRTRSEPVFLARTKHKGLCKVYGQSIEGDCHGAALNPNECTHGDAIFVYIKAVLEQQAEKKKPGRRQLRLTFSTQPTPQGITFFGGG